MKKVQSLKRPLTVPNDPLKLLVCRNCKKDNVVLNLKTCGCLFCNSCDGDTRDICVSCQSKIDPKIKLSFLKNTKCKFYKINECYNTAEYKCKCLNCFVCESCLTNIHSKRLLGSCDPVILRPKVTNNPEPCELCKEFIAEFKLITEPFTKICFNCKINKKAICTSYEKNIVTNSIWNQFDRDFVQSSQLTCDKIKQLKKILESSALVREQEIKKCKDAISEIQKCLDEYTEQYDRQIITLKQQLDSFNKISKILQPDANIKTILDSLQTEKLALYGEQGKDQISNFFKYYREKNNYYNPVTEQIKIFVFQNDSSRQHLLKFPLPPSSNSGVSADSDTSVQEIIDNGVKPFIIAVETPTTANERENILKYIEDHRDEWVRTKFFSVNSKVIIFDADATDTHKYKRAKILKKGLETSQVFLLDFGFEITVKNSSIGRINEIDIDGHKSCFLAQLTGNVDVKCGIEQKSWISQISRIGMNALPKAQHIHFLD